MPRPLNGLRDEVERGSQSKLYTSSILSLNDMRRCDFCSGGRKEGRWSEYANTEEADNTLADSALAAAMEVGDPTKDFLRIVLL